MAPEPGSLDFYCKFHPDEMKGVISIGGADQPIEEDVDSEDEDDDADVDVDVEDSHQTSITSRMQTAVSGHAPWNSRELRSCGCTSSRSMVLNPRFLK